ncbi:MAG TPA: deoxyribodipyrimidine photo-lyase [Methanomassiliicoccales archaeon]|jgi:deoxyribodipyrimidine photo-lyase
MTTKEIAEKRSVVLRKKPYSGGRVIYWMDRDQRAQDNWALIYAMKEANDKGVPLCVVFCLYQENLGATLRQYHFMVGGLRQLETRLGQSGIGFYLLEGLPGIELPAFLYRMRAGLLVTDFDPLRTSMDWKQRVVAALDIPVVEVDAHNIVPCREVSKRRVMSFASFREKVIPLLPEYLVDYPESVRPDLVWEMEQKPTDWDAALNNLHLDDGVKPLVWISPGEEEAGAALERFCRERMSEYPEGLVDPSKNAQSDLSPYLHFGQLSSQRAVLNVKATRAEESVKSLFIDQIVVKKEIADNFCLHTPIYDSVGALPEWARRTINGHRSDIREHLYSLQQLDQGLTHDPLWNAAQMELVKRGKIHGYLREYWANKIMEWTRSPEEAFSFAIHLNDRYSLDGRDPSGYTGIAMVIGGLYGRPWQSKEVLGKVRRMTYTGARLKFDIHAYEEKVKNL